MPANIVTDIGGLIFFSHTFVTFFASVMASLKLRFYGGKQWNCGAVKMTFWNMKIGAKEEILKIGIFNI